MESRWRDLAHMPHPWGSQYLPSRRSLAHSGVGGHMDGQVQFLSTSAQIPLEMLGQYMPRGHVHHGSVGKITAVASGDNCNNKRPSSRAERQET
jgi:hypothetical protein